MKPLHLANEAVISQHQQMRAEYHRRDIGERLVYVFLELRELFDTELDRLIEGVPRRNGNHFQLLIEVLQVSDRDPPGSARSVEQSRLKNAGKGGFRWRLVKLVESRCILQRGCEVGCEGPEGPQLLISDPLGVTILKGENADAKIVSLDGDPEEYRVRLLPEIRDRLVERRVAGVVLEDGAVVEKCVSRESLAAFQTDLADEAGIEAGRRPKDEKILLDVVEVDRADIRPEVLRHDGCEIAEKLVDGVPPSKKL
jgi:hypothetical protein